MMPNLFRDVNTRTKVWLRFMLANLKKKLRGKVKQATNKVLILL